MATKEAIIKAISGLGERGGSSLAAIKKALVAEGWDFDAGNQKSQLLKGLKSGVEKGYLIQNKGSYKIDKVKTAPKKKAAPKKAGKKKGGGSSALQAEKTLSKELAAICGFAKASRGQVVKAVWAYAKANGLHEGKVIKIDKTLSGVFGKKKSIDAFKEMQQPLSAHLS